MRLTKEQEDYVYNIMEALKIQFGDTMDMLKQINSMSNENFDQLSGQLGKMVIDGTITEEGFLKLPPNVQRAHINRIKKEIKETFQKEYELQKQMIEDELLTQGMTYEAYKQITLNGSVTMRPMKDMGKYLEIVNKEINGLDWSARLWNSKQNTVRELNKAIKDLGKGYATMSEVKKRVRQTQNTSTYNVNRLVRNELCRVQSEVNEKFDKENEIEWQLFMAKMDNRTTCICKDLDGKAFRRDDPKKPIPPNGTHIQCRSVLTGIPHKDWRPKNRRDKRDGKNEIIPYETWKEENMVKVTNRETEEERRRKEEEAERKRQEEERKKQEEAKRKAEEERIKAHEEFVRKWEEEQKRKEEERRRLREAQEEERRLRLLEEARKKEARFIRDENISIDKPIGKMNYEELQEKAKTLGIAFGDDNGEGGCKTLERDVLKGLLEWQEDFNSKFEGSENQRVFLYSTKSRKNACAWANSGGEIVMNENYYTKQRVTDILSKEHAKDRKIRSWWTPTTKPVADVYAHEFGHNLSLRIARAKKQDWDAYVKGIRQKAIKEVQKETGIKLTVKDMKILVSEYGGTNAHETFAEVFQELFNCNDNSINYMQNKKRQDRIIFFESYRKQIVSDMEEYLGMKERK